MFLISNIVIWMVFLQHLSSTMAVQRFYMEDDCSGKIDMHKNGLPAGRLSVTRRSKYRKALSCRVTIMAPHGRRIIVVFRKMDIEWEVNCDDDFLQLFDGGDMLSHLVRGLPTRICGTHAPRGSYITSGNMLTVFFNSDVYKQNNGFELIFTAFHRSPACFENEFRCSNGRCIADSLECNNYNNCGDESDECKVDSETLLAIILSVFLLTLIGVGGITVYRQKQKHTERMSKAMEKRRRDAKITRSPPSVRKAVFTVHPPRPCSNNDLTLDQRKAHILEEWRTGVALECWQCSEDGSNPQWQADTERPQTPPRSRHTYKRASI